MSRPSSKSWTCPVCGYLHSGDEPPQECPVCGCAKDLFEPYVEAVPAQAATRKWICPVCGYIHEGSQPPDECPLCGTAGSLFEPYEEEQVALPQASGPQRKFIIVGGGIAGVSAAEAVRQADAQAEIVLVGKEPGLPYYRLNLTRYLAGEVSNAQLPIHPQEWYDQRNIQLVTDCSVSSLALEKMHLDLEDETRLPFDKLILATGSNPFVPPIPGSERKNVTTLRTRVDADWILRASQGSPQVVCIGGGLLGLEAAGALAWRGARVTLLENQDWLLPRQLNPAAGCLLQKKIETRGIAFRLGAKVVALEGDEKVRCVALADGTALPADLVVISAGVRSNTTLARQAGLDINQGVIVNNQMGTSHPDVYAAGDVAEHRSGLYGTWGPAQLQGTVAGWNAAGQYRDFNGIPRSNTLKVLGVPMFSIGRVQVNDPAYQIVGGELDDSYCCFVFRDALLVGAVLLGDTSISTQVKRIIEERRRCESMLRLDPTPASVRECIGSTVLEAER